MVRPRGATADDEGLRARAFVTKIVMPGLVPGIHVFGSEKKEAVDGRDKPGHDDGES